MAGGAPDANGIWLYGPDDPRVPFHDTLNIGQQSVSTAVGQLKARTTALETYDDLTGIGTPFVAASGWTIGNNRGRKKAGFAFIEASFTRSGSAITVGSDGNFANDTMATFAAGWAPASGMFYPAVSLHLADFAGVSSTGFVLTAVAPGLTVPTGRLVQFTAVYPLA